MRELYFTSPYRRS